MPGPGKKGRKKGNARGKRSGGATPRHSGPGKPREPETIPCQTLEEDEMTRCDKPATEPSYSRPERCKVHQGQYRKLYKKYKDASKVVDETKQGNAIPTMEQIARLHDVSAILEKGRWVRKYLEAIRVEKVGRDIHQRRFFLKPDDGHKIRLKVLAKDMVKTIETLDSLHTRAFELYIADNPASEWAKSFQAENPPGWETPSTDDIIEGMSSKIKPGNPSPPTPMEPAAKQPSQAELEEEDLSEIDLIDLKQRAQKNQILWTLEPIINPSSVESFNTLSTLEPSVIEATATTSRHVLQQYARRIIFHEPVLFMKSLNKESFKDLLLDDDFSLEDLSRFALLFNKELGLGLLWLKDAVMEALIMSGRAGTSANVGDPKNRIKILGGWIFNRGHTRTMSNEGWWTLFMTSQFPANIENRLVRLCNDYDDMISFLSFAALGMMPPPSFCHKENPHLNALAPRNLLSLSGVIITDMVSTSVPPHMFGPHPSKHKSKKPGCIVWAEVETRACLFGAVRNEEDRFTTAFLHELRARPDLFQVVTRSETDPGQKINSFGTGSSDSALPMMRYRQFEAPPASPQNPPEGDGPWTVVRSAVDVLFGTDNKFPGHLTNLSRGDSAGWFFHFKKFPVKYIVILDTVPNRHHPILARHVAWAALCAQGYATGEYESSKYCRAYDKLFEARAKERLSWMPENWGGWQMGWMAN
ncbi:hypothetical protein Hypma_007277 [Hypsizygus marmoreus]|uniref:Uncharacterized protein n=1 Tax=Hypsizygus marmoreus TaxID=39966 RepID=A0A369KHV7_HYPMA|nr:hypothetical protein Hypma_007277 [Hypsizygus marmoreus]